PPIDASTVILRIAIGDDGRLAGPRSRAFWTLALDPDGPGSAQASITGVLGGDEADAAWLAGQVAGRDSRFRLGRLQALLYGQRVLATLDDKSAADAVDVVRAAMRMPALVFPLERAGMIDVHAIARLVRRARVLTAIPDAADRAVVLTEWQAGVAIVLRAKLAGSLRPE